jgi:hypothetical protein
MLRSLVKSSKRNFISLHKANARRNTSKVTGGTLADFIDAKQPWYKDGVKFNCTACGTSLGAMLSRGFLLGAWRSCVIFWLNSRHQTSSKSEAVIHGSTHANLHNSYFQ